MAQTWGFLTNHALVLVYAVRHAGATVREISAGVGVTERATLAILRQLSSDSTSSLRPRSRARARCDGIFAIDSDASK